MKQWFFLIILISIFFTQNAKAYFVATNTGKFESTKETHLFVAGVPDKLDELFIYSLLTKAQGIRERAGDVQLVIIGRNEDREMIVNRGYKIVEKNREQLKDTAIEGVVNKLKNIKSLDIYAHSGPLNGILLDRGTIVNQLLNEENDLWPMFQGKLNKKSYFMFHGCNAGLKMAPVVAKKLKIAVFAALTGTDFQSIYNEISWVHDYNARDLKKSEANLLSLEQEKSCSAGYCRRMKPDNTPYSGYWGEWLEGGFPSYKVFCGSNDTNYCQEGALAGVLEYPSVMPISKVQTLDQFKEILRDFLCPFSYSSKKQAECAASLEASLSGENTQYSPFNGQTLSCDFIRCAAYFKCKNSSSSSCHLVNEKPGANETFTNEYKFFIKSFESRND